MTPERQKWWDNLPQREKELREALKSHQLMLKINKDALNSQGAGEDSYILKLVRRQKLIIKALKHRMERGSSAKVKKNRFGYYCSWCHQFVQRYDNYCGVCGKKLRWGERKREE